MNLTKMLCFIDFCSFISRQYFSLFKIIHHSISNFNISFCLLKSYKEFKKLKNSFFHTRIDINRIQTVKLRRKDFCINEKLKKFTNFKLIKLYLILISIYIKK